MLLQKITALRRDLRVGTPGLHRIEPIRYSPATNQLCCARRSSFPVSRYRHHAGNWKPLQPNYFSFFLSFFLSFFATLQNTLEGCFISVAWDSVPTDISDRVDDVKPKAALHPTTCHCQKAILKGTCHALIIKVSHSLNPPSLIDTQQRFHRQRGSTAPSSHDKNAKSAFALRRSKSTLWISLQTGDDSFCNLPTLTNAMLTFLWDLRYNSNVLLVH